MPETTDEPPRAIGWGGDETTGYPYENGITFHRADNYGFDDFASYPNTHDVGLVVLDEAYTPPSGTFGILPTPVLVDQLVVDAGSNAKKSIRFRTSDYGLIDQDPRPVSCRERQMAWGYLIENSSGVTEFNSRRPPMPHRARAGRATATLVARRSSRARTSSPASCHSGRNSQCKGQDFTYRIDWQDVLD